MIASKNTNDVHTVDLPESICVETRFITPTVAKQKKTEELLYITNKNGNIEFTKQAGHQISAITSILQVGTVSNNAKATVQQNQLQTTVGMKTCISNSIGVQCNLDEELYDPDIEWPPLVNELNENAENIQTQKQDFLKFVNENSTHYKHYKECLICGEICKTDKYFYGHMEMHRGPQTLCCKCGNILENEQLLLNHNCRKDRQLEKCILRCPFYNCSVVAISRLELYDHINEHSNDRMYKCTGCNAYFCTGQEFLRHLLIRAKCYTNAKRKLFRVYGLKSPKDRLCRVRVFTLHTRERRTIMVKSFLSQRLPKKGLCKICLKSFVNKSIYIRHRSKCVAKFRKRLMRKRRAAAANS